MDEEAQKKFRELKTHTPFLKRLIDHLKKVAPIVGEKRTLQLTRITDLYNLLMKDNIKLPLSNLLRCECIILKLLKQFKTMENLKGIVNPAGDPITKVDSKLKSYKPYDSSNTVSETSVSHTNSKSNDEPSFTEVRQKLANAINATTSNRNAVVEDRNRSSTNTANSSSTVYSSSILNVANINIKDPRMRKAAEATLMAQTPATQPSFLSYSSISPQMNNNSNQICSSIPMSNNQYQQERPIPPLMSQTLAMGNDDVANNRISAAHHSADFSTFGYNQQAQCFYTKPQQFNEPRHGSNDQHISGIQNTHQPPPRRSSLYNEKSKVNLQEERPSSSLTRPIPSIMTNNNGNKQYGSSFDKDNNTKNLNNDRKKPEELVASIVVEPSHLDKLYRGDNLKLNFLQPKLSFKIPRKGGGEVANNKTTPEMMSKKESKFMKEASSSSSIVARKTYIKEPLQKVVLHSDDRKMSKSKKEIQSSKIIQVTENAQHKHKVVLNSSKKDSRKADSGVGGDVTSTSDKENTAEDTNTTTINSDVATSSTSRPRIMKRRCTMVEFDSAPLCTTNEVSKKSKVYEDVYSNGLKEKRETRQLAKLFEETDDNCCVSTQNIILSTRRSCATRSQRRKQPDTALEQTSVPLNKSDSEKTVKNAHKRTIKSNEIIQKEKEKIPSTSLVPSIRKCAVRLKRLPRLLELSNDILNKNRPNIRNIWKKWHSLSTLVSNCIICEIDLKQDLCVSHYVQHHKEFYASRLHSSIFKQLIKNKRNRPNHAIITFQRRKKYFHRCPFCLEGKSLMFFHWMEHLVKHTGEYNFGCTKCLLPKLKYKQLESHVVKCHRNAQIKCNDNYSLDNRDNIEGHVCHLCNFVQLSRNNLDKHFIYQHDFEPSSAPNMGYKVNLIDFRNVPDVMNPHDVDRIEFILINKFKQEALKIVLKSQFGVENTNDDEDDDEEEEEDDNALAVVAVAVAADAVAADAQVNNDISDAVVEEENEEEQQQNFDYEQIQQEMLTLAAAQTQDEQPENDDINLESIDTDINLESPLQEYEGSKKYPKIVAVESLFRKDLTPVANNIEISDVLLENSQQQQTERNDNIQTISNLSQSSIDYSQSRNKRSKSRNKRRIPSINKYNKFRAVLKSIMPQTDNQLLQKTTSETVNRSLIIEENNNEMELENTTTITTADNGINNNEIKLENTTIITIDECENNDCEFANVFRPLITNMDTLLADGCIDIHSIDNIDRAPGKNAATATSNTFENFKSFESKSKCVKIEFDDKECNEIVMTTTPPDNLNTLKILPSDCFDYIEVDDDDIHDDIAIAFAVSSMKESSDNYIFVVDDDDNDDDNDPPDNNNAISNVLEGSSKTFLKKLPDHHHPPPVPSSSSSLSLMDSKKLTGLIKVRPLSCLLPPPSVATQSSSKNCDDKMEDEEPIVVAESFVAHESNRDFHITQTVSANYKTDTTLNNVGFNISLEPNFTQPSARLPLQVPVSPVRVAKAPAAANLKTNRNIYNMNQSLGTTTTASPASALASKSDKRYIKCNALFCRFKTLVANSMRDHLMFHQSHNFSGKSDFLECTECSYAAKDIDDFMNHGIAKHNLQVVNEKLIESNPLTTTTNTTNTTITNNTSSSNNNNNTSDSNLTQEIRNILATSVIRTDPESLPSVINPLTVRMVEYLVASTGVPDNKILKCPVKNCQIVTDEDSYNTHVLYHTKATGTTIMLCPHCHKVMQNLAELKKHLLQHGRHNNFCFECLATARYEEDMRKHISVIHCNSPTKIYRSIIEFEKNTTGISYFAISARKIHSKELNDFYMRLRKEFHTRVVRTKIYYKPCEVALVPKRTIFEQSLFCEECNFSTCSQLQFVAHLKEHISQADELWKEMKKSV